MERLVEREQALSSMRRELHRQIDRLYLAAPLGDADIAQLERLERAEREISTSRHRVHREIDALRALVGMPPWRHAMELTDAA